ncbi:MAG: PQQ-binding-like beta-propeller repeat protein [Phycisphaerae bacterium]|nr:PQQ-binding-like beta-propeller repeat protein [Phycisphaerae bacterium]
MGSRVSVSVFGVMCLLAIASPAARAEDWPTYQHDNRRSGVTGEQLQLPLQKAWEYVPNDYPRTAWSGPAKWDSYAGLINLKSMRDFDPVFYVTVAQGGVFFGSSIDNAVHGLDAASGREKWVVFTNGPVRLPPSFHDGKLYFGCDDGCVYCVRCDSGQIVWRHEVSPGGAQIPLDGRLTSLWPCRTGVLVQDARVYFAASLLPWQKTYLCALDAQTGASDGPGLYRKQYEQMTAQGPMLASAARLYLSQGRQIPLVFDRASGNKVQSLGGSGFGGVFGLLTEDSIFVHGHGQNHRADGELRFFGGDKNDLLVTFPGATSIVIHSGIVYLHADGWLQAFDRDSYVGLQTEVNTRKGRIQQLQEQKKKLPSDAGELPRRQFDAEIANAQAEISALEEKLPACFVWRTASDCPLTLILAGDTLFAGGEGRVTAYEAATGEETWTASVEGRAYGLAAAGGSLFVSTDLGRIICLAAP